MCKYFWDPAVRLEWEATLDTSRVIEALSDNTLIFHQALKRVWPAAQRDTCFWSHIRAIPSSDAKNSFNEMSDWIVVNYSTNHDLAPVNTFFFFLILNHSLNNFTFKIPLGLFFELITSRYFLKQVY